VETRTETVVEQKEVVDTPVETKVEVQPETDTQTEAVQAYPDFAQQSFQCLVFDLAGLSMAIPLEKLCGILEWNEELVTPMPGHSPWFMGLLPERGTQIKVIDAAQLVVPGKYRSAYQGPPVQKVILINDGEWGIACKEVKEVVTLDHEQVKWRQVTGGKRPWLLGTVIDKMCALLDADEFAKMLASEKVEII
jgi:purine-binding chemotaxis protein CheW